VASSARAIIRFGCAGLFVTTEGWLNARLHRQSVAAFWQSTGLGSYRTRSWSNPDQPGKEGVLHFTTGRLPGVRDLVNSSAVIGFFKSCGSLVA